MINLTCKISDTNAPPGHIFWYHQDEVISYYSKRGGVSIVNEKGEVTISQLLIRDANLNDQVFVYFDHVVLFTFLFTFLAGQIYL